jgi:hypothetical protein
LNDREVLEDAQGELRLNTYEETLFRMGCHSTVGATIDRTLSFEEITVTAWIRPRSLWGAQTIVGRQLGSGGNDDMFFGLHNDQLTVMSRTFRKRLDRPLPGTEGQWIHVAFTRRADGTVTLYAAGAPIGTNRAAG